MTKKEDIILTADWGNELSDLIGKISFTDNEKANLYYDLIKKYPQAMSFGIGYIENTNTGETELIEVSLYVDHEKIERHKQRQKLWQGEEEDKK